MMLIFFMLGFLTCGWYSFDDETIYSIGHGEINHRRLRRLVGPGGLRRVSTCVLINYYRYSNRSAGRPTAPHADGAAVSLSQESLMSHCPVVIPARYASTRLPGGPAPAGQATSKYVWERVRACPRGDIVGLPTTTSVTPSGASADGGDDLARPPLRHGPRGRGRPAILPRWSTSRTSR
jgi:hypothetical protein